MKRGNWFIGVLIIILGILALFRNLGFTEVGIGEVISSYWPFLLIFWGLKKLFNSERKDFLGGTLLLVIGVLLQGQMFYDYDLSWFWSLFWPAILIFIGFSFIKAPKTKGGTDWAFMGGLEKDKKGWNLDDGNYWAVMGGIELDLTKAEIVEGEYILICNAIMGGIEIRVPEDIKVLCEGTAVLGGIEFFGKGTGGIISSCKAEQNEDLDNKKVVRIYCRAIMGGIEIK